MSNKFTALELDLFALHTCSTCFQPDEARARADRSDRHGCPHLLRAYGRDQMPGAWTRRRNGPLGASFKCEDFTPAPESTRRKTVVCQTEPLFGDVDIDQAERLLIPVDGWPDYRGRDRKTGSGDHQ